PISKPKSAAQLRRALLETSAFLENAQLLEAAQRLAQAIALDPKNYELLFTVAALMETAQEYEAAENLAQRVVGLSPRHYEAWMLLAKLAQDEPDGVDRAVEALKQAVSLRPEEVEPRLQLCDLLMEKEDFQGAQEIAMEALHLQRDGETLSLLGEVLLAQGEHAKAIPLLKEASGFLPGDTLIRQHLAEGYLQAGERTKAFAILTELLRQHPGDPDLLLLLDAETPDQLRSARGGGATSRALLDEAEATFEDNHLPESLSLVRQAQQREKTQRGDWLQLQLAWATDPKNHVAQAMTFTASARHPRLCFHALRLLVDWHGERNDEAALFAALDAYLAVHPKSSGAWEAAVIRQAYRLMSGHATEADLEETRRLHVQPLPGQEARVRSLLGQYLLDFKRPNEVLDLLEPVMRNEPTLINHFQLGSALVALGEVEEALDVLNDGLHAPPGDLPEAQAQILQAKMQGLVDELKKSHHLG
ncbi:MAG: tetratricopeptide repeat protein, partial [Firmicutes bacterium]|nr:tetratricopeptide repeat protein [Bacillota bacterium]